MSASTKKKLRKEENAAKLTEKQLTEQKEAKKLKGYTVAFSVVVVLVLVAAIVIMGVTAFKNSGMMQRNTDALTVGEHTLSNAQLNYFYVDSVNEYYSSWSEQYGDYAAMYMSLMGFDTTKPLNQLPYPTEDNENATYADYFTELAVSNATSTYAIYDLAVAAGHTIASDLAANVESSIAMAEMYGALYGYDSLDAYLKAIYGPGASEETYRNHLNVLAMADSYQTAYYNELTYDDAAIAAHNEENYDEFSSFDYLQYLVTVSDFVICTDPTNEEHTHSDVELAAAEEAAKAAADSLAAGTYENAEALNNAINALDVFAGAETKEACSANEDVFTSYISTDIAAWLTEEGRTAGEATAIPNIYTYTQDGVEVSELRGYYLVVFQGREDNNMNLVSIRHILAQFEGGTTDSTTGVTTYSEEEKAAALKAITEVKDQWLADGGTEDAFIALVEDNSDDTGSTGNGGLYEDVYPGQMVDAFNDWCFDTARKAGDYEIVETEYGYHLIYFVAHQDVTFRNYMVENTLRNADYEAWYNDAAASMDAKVLNTKYLSLDLVLSNG